MRDETNRRRERNGLDLENASVVEKVSVTEMKESEREKVTEIAWERTTERAKERE